MHYYKTILTGFDQEKYRRKSQLSQAPSIRSKCAWLSCGVLIISSLVVLLILNIPGSLGSLGPLMVQSLSSKFKETNPNRERGSLTVSKIFLKPPHNSQRV